jgi:hypothetical protein
MRVSFPPVTYPNFEYSVPATAFPLGTGSRNRLPFSRGYYGLLYFLDEFSGSG